MSTDVVPEGYVPHVRTSPVTDPWQPLFAKIAGGTVSLALRIRAAHCNGKGFLHGGVISALADNAMGLSIIETLRHQGISRGRGGSTVGLALDFLLSRAGRPMGGVLTSRSEDRSGHRICRLLDPGRVGNHRAGKRDVSLL
jgi:acyl-coenzyme A thioesterase PaaI-like protein